MMNKKIWVSGVGCCLVDELYNNVSFDTEVFSGYLSKTPGDGGLTPGQLVFQEEFEGFTGKSIATVLTEITLGEAPGKINIGGPGIVPLIHAAQMLGSQDQIFRFYGCRGDDSKGSVLLSLLRKTPVFIGNYKCIGAATPSTVVLSDPLFDNGNGERIFINSIGAAWGYLPENLDDNFFDSDVVVFGGTALVPAIHDHLGELLKKAKSNGCITIVNTVYDFRSEKENPLKRWFLGKNDGSYRNIDLLIVDREEAFRLSGEKGLDSAIQFFRGQGASAAIITNGPENIHLFSNGSLFGELKNTDMPVSNAISQELRKGYPGDTTGCGDNFAGGVIASLVSQLQNGMSTPDLVEASIWGIVSGGFSCFCTGGVFFEKTHGEKRRLIEPYYLKYKDQIGERS